MFSKERKRSVKVTPNSRRRMSSAVTNLSPTAEQCSLLIESLAPIMKKVTKTEMFDGGDVRHRAILGTIFHTLR